MRHLLDLHSRPQRTADRPVHFHKAPMVNPGLAVAIFADEIRYLGPLNALPMGDLPGDTVVHISERDYDMIDRKSKGLKQIGEVER